MKPLRNFLFNSGGRKFFHGIYVITVLLVVYGVLRWQDLLKAEHWDTTVGAIWKISGAFLAAHAADEMARHLKKKTGNGGT